MRSTKPTTASHRGRDSLHLDLPSFLQTCLHFSLPCPPSFQTYCSLPSLTSLLPPLPFFPAIYFSIRFLRAFSPISLDCPSSSPILLYFHASFDTFPSLRPPIKSLFEFSLLSPSSPVSFSISLSSFLYIFIFLSLYLYLPSSLFLSFCLP